MSKVAIVTGAGRRIGAQIARGLHSAGFCVVVHYRASRFEAEGLVAELNRLREHSALGLPLDLSQFSDYSRFIQQAVAEWGRLDLLVNNASSFYPTQVNTATLEQWDDLFTSNVKGAYFLSQNALPELQKTEGQIVNITDIHAANPLKGHSIYCMAKAALAMMTKSLARECGPNVRVNAVAPGAILWPEQENQLNENIQTQIIQSTALKRAGTPENISKAVLSFLENDFITGQILAVDGGRS